MVCPVPEENPPVSTETELIPTSLNQVHCIGTKEDTVFCVTHPGKSISGHSKESGNDRPEKNSTQV